MTDTTKKRCGCHCKKSGTTNPNDRFPGATIDTADDDRDTTRLIKERTHTLNDNPRDNN